MLSKKEQNSLKKTTVFKIIAITLIYLHKEGKLDNKIIEKVLEFLDGNIDGWALAHFLMHLSYGLLLSDRNAILISLIVGVSWEYIEPMMGEYWVDDANDDYKYNIMGLVSGLMLKRI